MVRELIEIGQSVYDLDINLNETRCRENFKIYKINQSKISRQLFLWWFTEILRLIDVVFLRIKREMIFWHCEMYSRLYVNFPFWCHQFHCYSACHETLLTSIHFTNTDWRSLLARPIWEERWTCICCKRGRDGTHGP